MYMGLIGIAKLQEEKQLILREINLIYKELNNYLNYCLKRTTCYFHPYDKFARKKVNSLEQLTNRLHFINDKLELMGAL